MLTMAKNKSIFLTCLIAYTKRSMISVELNEIEKTKIDCAHKFFDEINRKINLENMK